MTTHTKRRGRRSLAAILAAMLMASVLAVTAGAPAQAANTSSEALVDTNADGKPDAREFGGRDRYDTANRLAKNFGKANGLGNVSTAFVASGLKLVDAISVAGLAGALDAPVLLTPMDSLNGGVADFIEDYGVQTVHVLGGSAAVADSVVEAIEALANKPKVSRIKGADRYATAAAVASELGGAAAWCGGAEAAAFLANGSDLAYAMAASPVVNRLELPLLLTASDMLPDATLDFITDQDIEHVVIMGGETSVSDDVSAALTSAGVNTVTRIDGDSPADASAALAKLVTNGCKADLGSVSADHVALVAESGLPDGVAASPVLAGTYDNNDGELVPMLVVTDELPASVRDYLAATPKSDGTNKLHLGIVAVGGTAAVSEEVMKAAVAAAMSADALTVQITSDVLMDGSATEYKPPQAGSSTVVLRFSDNIVSNAANNTVTPPIPADRLLNLVRDNLEVNGAPARLAATTPVVQGESSTRGVAACVPDIATVTLASPLKGGDVISLADGAKFGANKDGRTVAGVEVTVPAKKLDTTRPTVTVVAIAGTGDTDTAKTNSQVAKLTFSDNVGGDGLDDTADAGKNVVTTDADAADDKGDEITISSSTPGQAVTASQSKANGETIGFAKPLVAGDRITIKSGAVVDKAGNTSRGRTFSVIAPQKSPKITAVTMSSQVHTAQASAVVPAAISDAQQNNPAIPATFDGITITAKKGGAADGAAGNKWNMVFDVATGWKDDPKAAVDIAVRVNSTDRLVSVQFKTGKAKFADLKSKLEANSTFDALFKVTLPAKTGAACGTTANNPLGLQNTDRQVTVETSGGLTALAIEVKFNAYAKSIDAAGELADDVFAQVIKRYNDLDPDNAVNGTNTTNGINDASIPTRLQANLVNNADGTAAAGTNLGPIVGPKNSARYELVTDKALLLPKVRDLVSTAAGSVDTASPNIAPVAGGYALDDPNTLAINEAENAKSGVRIGQNSSVKAPNFKAATS